MKTRNLGPRIGSFAPRSHRFRMARLLTKRQIQILQIMRADPDGENVELVYERGEGWLGLERVAPRTVFALLRLCAISKSAFGGESVERYRINETGRGLLAAALKIKKEK